MRDRPTGRDEFENLDKMPNPLGKITQIILTKDRKMGKTDKQADLTLGVKISQAREVLAADSRGDSGSR